MSTLGLKTPTFLNLTEEKQKTIIQNIEKGDIPETEKQANLETMIFIQAFQKKLKINPKISNKQIRKLFAAHAEQLKKLNLIC